MSGGMNERKRELCTFERVGVWIEACVFVLGGRAADDRESAMFGMQLRPLGAVAPTLCLIVSLLHNPALQ